MKKLISTSAVIFGLLLSGCGNSGPSNADVVSAVREYEGMEHKLKMEWNGVNTTLPVKLTYTKVENVSCTMVGDAEAICSVNLEGTSSAVEGMIKKNFSGIEKFHLYKIDGKWKTEDAIKNQTQAPAQSQGPKISYETYKEKKLQEGWVVMPKRDKTLSMKEDADSQYCYEGVCTVEFTNVKNPSQVLQANFAYCIKELSTCENNKDSGTEFYSDKVISQNQANKDFADFKKQTGR
jgi:hypothetical protein